MADIVRGNWGFQGRDPVMMNLQGTSTPVPVPTVQLGVVSIDRQGRYTGHWTMSVGGQIQEFDVAGSIQVNSDCSATDTFTAGPSQGTGRYVILDNGNEMRAVATTLPLGPAAGMATYRRISWGEPQCTADGVRDVYGETAEGIAVMSLPGQPQPVPMPFSAVFIETHQAAGSGTAVGTASLGGTILDVQFPKMSWAVNSEFPAQATVSYLSSTTG